MKALEQSPDMETLLHFDADGWRLELSALAEYLQQFEPRVPEPLHQQLARASAAVG